MSLPCLTFRHVLVLFSFFYFSFFFLSREKPARAARMEADWCAEIPATREYPMRLLGVDGTLEYHEIEEAIEIASLTDHSWSPYYFDPSSIIHPPTLRPGIRLMYAIWSISDFHKNFRDFAGVKFNPEIITLSTLLRVILNPGNVFINIFSPKNGFKLFESFKETRNCGLSRPWCFSKLAIR